MNPELLLNHFDRISEAPDAIPRLRRFILDLAVRGKLVKPNVNDEPACALLERIAQAKRRLVSLKKLRKFNELLPLSEVDYPFEVPPLWGWTRLANVYDVRDGTHDTPRYVETGYPLVTSKNLSSGRLSFDDIKLISEQDHRQISDRSAVEKGDVLLAMIGSIGNPVIVDTDRPFSIKNVALFKHYDRSFSNSGFLCLFLQHATAEMLRLSAGGLQPFVSLGFLRSYPIALPPLAEQHRIVDKVDELMALCERLEVLRVERETRRDRLAAAADHYVTNGANAEDFRGHASFYLRHIPQLTTRPDQIEQLRQTILRLAVRGRLVRQDPAEKPAPSFGVIGKDGKNLSPGWTWARVEDVADARLGKMLDVAKNSGRRFRYLRNTNVHWFDVRMDELKELKIEESEVEKYRLRQGDVLICEGGHGIGRTAVWRNDETDIVFQKALHRVRPRPALDSNFFSYCMFVYFHDRVLQTYFTGVGIPHFTGRALAAVVFPLPPIAEQRRIVAKVEELITLCDQVEARITVTQEEKRSLLESVLYHALADGSVRNTSAGQPVPFLESQPATTAPV